MLDINHILVVLDKHDEEQPGLQDSFSDQASQLADTTASSVKQALLRQAQLWLDSLTELDSCKGLRVNTEVHWQKHLHDAAIESARDTEFDATARRLS